MSLPFVRKKNSSSDAFVDGDLCVGLVQLVGTLSPTEGRLSLLYMYSIKTVHV